MLSARRKAGCSAVCACKGWCPRSQIGHQSRHTHPSWIPYAVVHARGPAATASGIVSCRIFGSAKSWLDCTMAARDAPEGDQWGVSASDEIVRRLLRPRQRCTCKRSGLIRCNQRTRTTQSAAVVRADNRWRRLRMLLFVFITSVSSSQHLLYVRSIHHEPSSGGAADRECGCLTISAGVCMLRPACVRYISCLHCAADPASTP